MASSTHSHASTMKYNYERSFFRWVSDRHPVVFEKEGIAAETLEQAQLARAAFYKSDWPGARMLVEPEGDDLAMSIAFDESPAARGRYCRTALFEGIIERGLREGMHFSTEHMTRDERAKLGIAWDATAGQHFLTFYGAPSCSTSLIRASKHEPPPGEGAEGRRAEMRGCNSSLKAADLKAPAAKPSPQADESDSNDFEGFIKRTPYAKEPRVEWPSIAEPQKPAGLEALASKPSAQAGGPQRREEGRTIVGTSKSLATRTPTAIDRNIYERSFYRWLTDTHSAQFGKHGLTASTLALITTARAAFYNSDWPGARMLAERKKDDSATLTASSDSSTAAHQYCRTALFEGIIEKGLVEDKRFRVEHMTSDEKAKLGIACDGTSGTYYLTVYGLAPSSTSLTSYKNWELPIPSAGIGAGCARVPPSYSPLKAADFEGPIDLAAETSEDDEPREEDSARRRFAWRWTERQKTAGVKARASGRPTAASQQEDAEVRVVDRGRKNVGASHLPEELEKLLRDANSLGPDDMATLDSFFRSKEIVVILEGPTHERVKYHEDVIEEDGTMVRVISYIFLDYETRIWGRDIEKERVSSFRPESKAELESTRHAEPPPLYGGGSSAGSGETRDTKEAREVVDAGIKAAAAWAADPLVPESFGQEENRRHFLAGEPQFSAIAGCSTASSAGGSGMATVQGTEALLKRQKRTAPKSHRDDLPVTRARPDSWRTPEQGDGLPVIRQAVLGESQESGGGFSPSDISPIRGKGGEEDGFDWRLSREQSIRAPASLTAKIPNGSALQKAVLTSSLGPGPAVYASKIHEVELEIQEGSLKEDIPLPITVTPSVKFVVCRTGEVDRAPFHDGTPAEEFMAMTFVHGPEEAIFRDDRPARLRFFMGFADEFACSETPDEAVTDNSIEHHILESYRPLTSPDGEENWTVLGAYSVVFRIVGGRREVWAETPLKHFCTVTHGVKISIKGYDDLKHGDTSYYYGNIGGFLTKRLKGTSPTPKIRFGNATTDFATFTSYPIVEHTDVASERSIHAEVGAAGGSIGGGKQKQSSISGYALPAVREPQTTVVRPGSYHDGELVCDIKAHLQMRVKVGILQGMTGGTNGMMNAEGSLQLLDSLPISGYKILVLRQPRLETPSQYKSVGWPCTADDIRAM